MTDNTPVNMRPQGAAHYLGVSVQFLNKARMAGTGPLYIKAGTAVIYRRADLDAWLAAHVQQFQAVRTAPDRQPCVQSPAMTHGMEP
ncbi:hypothetical protein CCP4SC76_2580015 [Gammaproteobacteria bacterium]